MGEETDGVFETENNIKRIKTGIPGLDHILEGGFPHPSSIVVTGNSGTGKTIFGLQYLYNGIQEYDEPGIYLRIQGYETDLDWYSKKFGLNVAELQEQEDLILTTYEMKSYEQFNAKSVRRETIKKLSRIIDSIGAKRIVIDSITPFGYFASSVADYRSLFYSLSRELKKEGCTTIFMSERTSDDELTPFQVEQYVADGMIELKKTSKSSKTRRKMHLHKVMSTRTPLNDISFNLSDDGFKLLPSYYQ